MSLLRIIVCVLLPPAAVIDKGFLNFLFVLILTIFFWIPGVIAALYICKKDDAITA